MIPAPNFGGRDTVTEVQVICQAHGKGMSKILPVKRVLENRFPFFSREKGNLGARFQSVLVQFD